MEFFDICDERGLPTGEVVERSVAHSKGILHRTAHVWIIKKVDGRWQVLLQKRSKDKDSYPGQFDTSWGSLRRRSSLGSSGRSGRSMKKSFMTSLLETMR